MAGCRELYWHAVPPTLDPAGMKFKRRKVARRILDFFRISFGFVPPYQVRGGADGSPAMAAHRPPVTTRCS